MPENKKKIFYLTTTNWWWAKQRPQFIAEGLSKFYKVTYVYPKTYGNRKNAGIPTDISTDLELLQIFKLPLNRFRLIRFLNRSLFLLQILPFISRYNFFWFSHPIIYNQIKRVLPNHSVIVYDCMDDHLEFPSVKRNKKQLTELFESEKNLVNIADTLIFSAEHLKDIVISRYKSARDYSVINNAVSKEFIWPLRDKDLISQDFTKYDNHFKLVYTGTISAWFDFDLILESLKTFPNIVYFLAGPAEINIPSHERIIYLGPVSHTKIKSLFGISDALVMPFRDNDLVRSVNPVKIYEYIAGCKLSIILKYPETDKFRDFVYLFSTTEEYLTLISRLIEGILQMKKTSEECVAFCCQNTWDERIKEIIQILDGE